MSPGFVLVSPQGHYCSEGVGTVCALSPALEIVVLAEIGCTLDIAPPHKCGHDIRIQRRQNCIQSTASRRYTDRHSNQIAQHIDRCGNGLIHARGGMSTDHRPNISCLEILELRGLDTGIRTLLEYHPRSGRASALPAWGVVLIRERRIAGNDVDAL